MTPLGEDLPERTLLAAIVDATEDAVLSVDALGRITSWNSGACTVYGYEPAEVLGQPFSVVVPGGDASQVALHLDTLWNELLADAPYSLLCACRRGAVPLDADADLLRLHSHCRSTS